MLEGPRFKRLHLLGGQSFMRSFFVKRPQPRPASDQARLSFPTAKPANSNSRPRVLPSKLGCSPPITMQSCSTQGLSLPALPRSIRKQDYFEAAEAGASADVLTEIDGFFFGGMPS